MIVRIPIFNGLPMRQTRRTEPDRRHSGIPAAEWPASAIRMMKEAANLGALLLGRDDLVV
jgi:hypothetical protein